MVSSTGQAMMQGLMAANQMRMNAARESYMNALGTSSLGNLAIAQKLEPVRAALMNAQGTSLLGNLAVAQKLEPSRAAYFSGMGARGAESAAAQKALLPYQTAEANLKVNPLAAAAFMNTKIGALMGNGGALSPAISAAPMNTGTQSVSPALASGQIPGAQNGAPTAASGPTPYDRAMALAQSGNIGAQAALSMAGVPIANLPEMKVSVAAQNVQNAQNIKLAQSAFLQNQSIVQLLQNMDHVQHILNTDPGIFHPGSTFIGKLPGVNDPNRGNLVTTILPQVASIVHTMGTRGGSSLYNKLSRLKINLDDNPGQVAGKIYATRKLLQQYALQYNQQYKMGTGKDMNLANLNNYLTTKYNDPSEMVPVEGSDGSKKMMTRFEASQLGIPNAY
jgi:hypothetical protein